MAQDTAQLQAPPILERNWSREGWPGHIERFDAAETPFYGGSIAEGICPNLHEEDADQHDREPRRLLPILMVSAGGTDGTWLECVDCGALWRFRPIEAGPPTDCACARCRGCC
jgi:hypothetical protein